MRVRTLKTELWLPRSRNEVFPFFGDAWNLDALTPPWLHFRILTAPGLVMQRGAILEYTIRWHGWPLSWKTEISAWEPPHRFVDRQLSGPYRQWIHEHTFEERNGGTLVHDRVDYAIPGGPCEPILHRWIVGPDVARIFAYRQARLQALFS